jgi:hypothetical protein
MSATGIQGWNSVTINDPFGGTTSASIDGKIDYLASARPRIGFLPVGNLLIYGTGGLG